MTGGISGIPVVALIREALASPGQGADPERAIRQQAYMKSTLPYRGFSSPELKRLLAPLLAAQLPTERPSWETAIRELWDAATHREEWYAALAVARHRRARAWLDADCLSLAEHLITTGAWWDVVDETAQHVVGTALRQDRARVAPVLRHWAGSEELWLRRTAVIAQNGHRGDTDLDLLVFAIESNLDDRSFWLRKAIGWALRDYARTDPAWVVQQVERWSGPISGASLSGLSRREALKHLPIR